MKQSGLILAMFAVVGSAQALEAQIAEDKVPVWVLQTAQQASPGASFKKIQVDTDDGDTVFEFKGQSTQGQDIEIDVNPVGTLSEIETIINNESVPATVRAMFDEHFPGFKSSKVESSERPSKEGILRTWYEFDGVTSQGKAVDVEINSNATVYMVEPD